MYASYRHRHRMICNQMVADEENGTSNIRRMTKGDLITILIGAVMIGAGTMTAMVGAAKRNYIVAGIGAFFLVLGLLGSVVTLGRRLKKLDEEIAGDGNARAPLLPTLEPRNGK